MFLWSCETSFPWPRLTVFNATYARCDDARTLILEYLRWSFESLSALLDHAWCIYKFWSFFISCKESDIQTHVHVWGRGYCQDKNRYPRVDPWGHQLDSKRASMADQEIVPGYVYILDGMQADQDYLRAVFSLKGYVTRQVCCWSLTMDEQPTWWTKWPQQIVYSLRAARRHWNHQLTGISANQRTHTTDFDPRIWSVQTLSRPNAHCSLSVDPRPMLFRFAGPHWPGLHVSGRQ